MLSLTLFRTSRGKNRIEPLLQSSNVMVSFRIVWLYMDFNREGKEEPFAQQEAVAPVTQYESDGETERELLRRR